MSNTKKLTSLIFAIIFGIVTCGIGFVLPMMAGKIANKVETATAVDYSADLVNSGLSQDANGFYKIENVENLRGLAYAVWQGKTDWASGNYVLGNDLDLGSAMWTPIGTATNPFVGKFNGNGHTIQGVISVKASTVDTTSPYSGLFGNVGDDDPNTVTAIYDLVIGKYSFTPAFSDYATSGRLAGYVKNTILADIYDWQYFMIPQSLEYQTIGTLGTGVEIFGGNSFVLAETSTEADGGWSYNLKTPQNYTPTDYGFQFGYGATSGLTVSGASVYIVGDEDGKFYSKDDESKTDLGGVRILKDQNGAVVDATTKGIFSDRYAHELPTILGENGTSSVVLAPIGTGRKPTGYVEDVNATTSPIKTISSYDGEGPLYIKWKELNYSITVNLGYNNGSGTTYTVTKPYNTPWTELVSELSRPNDQDISYILKTLRDHNDSKVYYSAEVSWPDGYEQSYVVEPSFPNGDTITAWDAEGASTVSVVLDAEWQQSLTNITVNFDTAQDTTLNFGKAFAGEISAVYQSTDQQDLNLPITGTPNTDGSFNFSAAGGAGIEITIPLNAGYELAVGEMENAGSTGSASVALGSNNSYILTIEDVITNDAVISIPIFRTQKDINVNIDNGVESISVSGSAGTTYVSTENKITTRIDEEFVLSVNYKKGYDYQNLTATNNINYSTSDNGKTFNISIGQLNGNNTITITTRALNFEAHLINSLDEEYSSAQLPGTVSLINGDVEHTWSGDGSWSEIDVPGQDGIKIKTINTAYYKVNDSKQGTVNGLKITTDPEGEAEAEGVLITCNSSSSASSGETIYTVTGIQPGETYYFHVYWAKQEYTATNGVGATSSVGASDFSVNIPGADGSYVSDADKVNIVTNVVKVNNASASSYNPFDTLTFTYNVVSQYYEFAGWYYKNGDAYILINNGNNIYGSTATISGQTLSFSAPTQNVEVFAGVTGKTATVSFPADATYYYKHEGTITSAGKALSTLTPASSVSFKYGDPDFGSFNIVMGDGYNLSRVVIGPSSASLANADDFYDFGTNLNYNGYQTVQTNSAVLEDIFVDGGAKIYVLATPKSASLIFNAGEGSGTAQNITYYFGIPVDITNAVNAFTKTGYTPSGWEINIPGNNTSLTDPTDETSSVYYKTSDGKFVLDLSAGLIDDIDVSSFTLTRTYTVNTYSLTLNAGAGTFEGSGNTSTIEGITFGQAIGQTLATPTRTGYTFGGWQIDGETITEDTVWTWAENKEATAIWTAKEYTININSNGGAVSGTSFENLKISYGQSFASLMGNSFFDNLIAYVTRSGFEINSLEYLNTDNTQIVKTIDLSSNVIMNKEAGFTGFDFDNSDSITLYVRWVFDESAISASFDGAERTLMYNASQQEITNVITNLNNPTGIEPVTEWQYSESESGSWSALPEGVTGLSTSLKVTNVAHSGYYRASLILTDKVGPSVLRDDFTLELDRNGKHIIISPAQLLEFTNITTGRLSGDGEKQMYEVVKYLYSIPEIKSMVQDTEADDTIISSFDAGALDSYETFEIWLSSGEYSEQAYIAKIFLSQLVLNAKLRDEYLSQLTNFGSSYIQEEIQFIESRLNSLVSEWGKGYLSSSTDNQSLLEKYVKIIFEFGGSSFNYTTDFNSTGNYWFDNVEIANNFTSQAEISDRFTILPIDNLTGDENIVTDAGKLTENTNAGLHEVVIKISPKSGFDYANFEGISKIDEDYYIVLTSDYLYNLQNKDTGAIIWNDIYSPILFPSITILDMPANQVIGEKSFEITVDLSDATNGKYTEVKALVETSGSEPGIYTFLNDSSAQGRLLVTSYELYVSGSSANKNSAVYYTITRDAETGTYSISATSGSGISTSDPILADVSLFINGDLEILDDEDENIETLVFQTVEATVDSENNQQLIGQILTEGYSVKINSIRVNGALGAFTISISSDIVKTDNYYREGNAFYDNNKTFLFQVNDLSNPSIIYFNTLSNYQVTSINVTSTNPAKENYNFVGFRPWRGEGANGPEDPGSIGDLAEELKSLLAWAVSTTEAISPVYDEGTLQSATYSAVYTNASWVTFDAKTDANQSFEFTPSSFFATIGSTVSFDVYDNSIDYKVYTFDGFGKNESSKEVTVANAPNQTFTAVIGLKAPTGVTIEGQNFAAQLEGNLDLSTLKGDVTITNNGSAHGITYTYKWYDSDPSEGGASAITSPIPANASSNGSYYVVVTATKTGFDDSDTAQASFTITFEKTTLSLTAPTESLTQTYKNEDFRNDITIGVALANDQASDLPTYPAGISLSAILSDSTLGSILDVTIQKQIGEGAWGDVGEDGITGAGTYQITVALKLDVNVGNAYEYASETGSITFDFTVEKAPLQITDENVSRASDGTGVDGGVLFSKSLDYNSDANRVYSVNVAVDGITGVNQITLNLKRADDKQTAGNYKLVINEDATYTALSANYDISIIDNTWFRILPSSGGLQAIATVVKKAYPENGIVDNTRIYNGAAHSSTVRIEKAIKEGTEDEYEFQLVTYLVYNGEVDSNNVEWARYSLVLQTVSDEDGTLENIDITKLDTSFFDGWTFTLDPGANVDSYEISCSGKNASYPSFEFIGGTTPTLEIVKKELTISDISMEYNGNSSFTLNTEDSNNEGNAQKFVVDGLIVGEDLNVTITFSNSDLGTYTYGAAEDWLNASLSDGTPGLADNYSLNLTGVSGQIIQSTKQLNLAMANNSFGYGQDGFDETTLKASLDSLIEKLGFSVTIGSGEATKTVDPSLYTIHIVSLTPEEAMEKVYSNATYLKAGKYVIAVQLTSNYYTVTDEASGDNTTNEFVLTVNQKDITATFDPITKAYDDDNVVEQEISLSDIIGSDVVRIDSATYNNKNVGKDKVVTIAISGDDAGNYNLTNKTVSGEITSATIVLNIDINQIFVDGQNASITGNVTSFTINYNQDLNASGAMSILTSPTKPGYTFNGWAVSVQGGSGTIGGLENGTTLSTENIMGFVDALREANQYSADIYATWEIKEYTLTINDSTSMGKFEISITEGSGKQTGSTAPSGDLETGTWTYTYTYYTEVTITRLANSGYVLTGTPSETFRVVGAKSIDVTNNDFRAANITIEISIDPDSYYGGDAISFENTGADVWTVSSYRAQTTLESQELSSTNLQTYFARTVLDGYTFSGWSYQNADSEKVTIDYNAGGTQNLSDIITKIYSSYTKDITVSFTAILKANKYELSFDANGGTLDEPGLKLDVTYGEAIDQDLPTPTRAGYVFGGWKIDGETITSETVWKWAENKEATAVWTDGDYSLTVTLTDNTANSHANVTISYTNDQGGTSYLTDENTDSKVFQFTLNRGKIYTITVSTGAGYNVTWPTSVDGFEMSGEGNARTIENIIQASNLALTISAQTHEVTIANVENATYEVKVDDVTPSMSENKFNASTEQTIVVTITPNNGYSVTGNATAVGAQISKNENKFTITGFTSNFTVNFANVVTANSFDATVKYNKNEIKVAGLSGTSTEENENITFTTKVSTGGELTFYIQDLHGYSYNDILVAGSATVNVDETPIVDGIYAGYRKVTVSGYTQTFGLEIKTTKVKFDVNASFVAVDSEFNIMQGVHNISVETATQQIEYLTSATVKAVNNNPAYGFIGWYDSSVIDEDGNVVTIDGDPISTDLAYTFTVEDNVSLVAIFQYNTYNVEIKIEYTERASDGNEHATIDVNGTENLNGWKQTMSYDDQLEVTANINAGYEIVGWYEGNVDDSAEGHGATYSKTITNDLTLILKVDAVDLSVEIVPTVKISGVSYSGEDIDSYGTIELGSYSDGEFTPTKDLISAKDFDVESYTGGDFYLRLSAKSGYKLDTLYNIAGNPTFRLIEEESGYKIYQISNLNSENTYQIEARFIAISTPINIVFSDGQNRLEAGRITVTVAQGLNIIQNNSHNVIVNATTRSTVQVTASITFGQMFVDEDEALNNLKITSNSGTISNVTLNKPESSTGWSAQISFKITGFTGSPIVEILVQPKTYFVQLVGWDGVEIGTPFQVTYGAPITLPAGLTISPRDGFALLGFYKYANGVGTRYIDGDLNPIGNWVDNGYQRSSNGTYVVSPNFDANTDTFRIFASYSINKARLQIDVVPPGLEDVPPTVAAKIVVLGTTTANSWSSSLDASFVEVREGAIISLQAPVYENYKFGYWTIVRTDKNGVSRQERVESETIENFEHDGYSLVNITLNYFAKVSVKATVGGTATYTYYDGTEMVEVADTEYIPTTNPIKLNATADPGYKFVGWFVGEQLLTMEPNFEYSASGVKPIEPTEFEAKFESQTFKMNIHIQDTQSISLQNVTVGGQNVDFEDGFDVKLDQVVVIRLNVADGLTIAWEGGSVTPLLKPSYLYRVAYADVVDGEINLNVYVSYEECDVNISVNVVNGNDTDKTLAASIYYFENSQAVPISAINGVTITRIVGSTLELQIDLRDNYRLDGITIDGKDSGAVVSGNIVRIAVQPQSAYADSISIQINLARDLWIDYVDVEDYELTGDGTDSNPYVISSAEDLSYMAYMINVEGSKEFANAAYVLGANIDLSGKFWSPIGTLENKFGGKFYYRNFKIEGVKLVNDYAGEVSKGGVFGYVSDSAEFEMPEGDWIIAVIIVSIVLLLIIIALIIFFVLRKKRKKKLEQLANS